MAKNLDLKQFLLQKGERLGMGVALAVMLLLIGLGAWSGFSSASPSDTAEDIKTKADAIRNKIGTTPAESPAEIDKFLLEPLKNEAVDAVQYAAATPNFIESGIENDKRNAPDIQVPEEWDVKVARVQVMDYMVSLAGDKTRVGVLVPKEKKEDKNQADLQKYLAQRGYGGKMPQIPPQLMQAYNYQQYMKLMQQMTQQPAGEFTAKPEWSLEFVESGKTPASAKLARAVHPYRMVVVSASFPWQKQLEAYKRALGKAVPELERDGSMPRFTKFAIQRRALDARGKVVEPWTKIDLERDLLPVLSHAVGYAPLEADENYLQPVAFDGLVIARPTLARGSYPKPELKLLAKSLQDFNAKTAGNTGVMVAAPGERNVVTGQSINLFGQEAAVEDQGKGPGPFNPRNPRGPRNPDGGPDPREKELIAPEHCLLRFCDTNNIQPGLTYQYQVKIRVENPNFNKPEKDLAFPGLAKDKEIESDWAPKDPAQCSVSITGETYYYATEIDDKSLDEKARREPKLRSDKDVTFMQIHRWLDTVRLNPENANTKMPVGDWTIAEVPVRRGEYIGRYEQVKLPIWFPMREGFDFATPLQTVVKSPIIGAKPVPGPKGIPVSFAPPGGDPELLVDWEGGSKTSQTFKLTEKNTKSAIDDGGVEMLVMSPDGRLRVLNSKADAVNADRKDRFGQWKKLLDDTENKVKKGEPDDPFKIKPKT